MKKVIIVLASLLMVSIAGISAAASTSSSSYDDRTFDQQMADLEHGTNILDLTIGRKAGRAEILGLLAEANYYGNGTDNDESIIQYRKAREAIGDYNKLLKNSCNESRYNELKIKYPDARPTMPGDLVDEYGDYIGPGASYDSDEFLHNDTVVMYLVYGQMAGSAEIVGQIDEESYYGNGNEKIDKAAFTGAIIRCNAAIRDYNKLLKTNCDESLYRYDDLKIEEFRI